MWQNMAEDKGKYYTVVKSDFQLKYFDLLLIIVGIKLYLTNFFYFNF